MSVLTKAFVVLLVICSLLLSASVVVFVNRVDDSKKAADAKEAKIVEVGKMNRELTAALEELKKTKADSEASAAKDLATKDGEIAKLNTEKSDKDTTIAGLNKEKDVAAAANKGVVDALRASEGQNKSLQDLLADIRGKYDSIAKQSGELNTAITVSDNKIRSLTKALEYEQEASAAKDARIKELETRVAGTGGSGSPASNRGTGGSLMAEVPDIKGVVRSVDMISGKKYATISVGSSSGVSKGMKFTAINRQTGEFLGYVTIDNVTPDEAIGQVEGPKVEKVQRDIQVQTQL